MPFRNLKLLIMVNKALGLLSCKLVNGRLKSSNIWSSCYCVIWVLFHCSYSAVYYYTLYTASPAEKATKHYVLFTVYYSVFLVALLTYNFVTIFWSESFVKLSDKFVTYDEKAIELGHQRKDKHIFTYLYFICMLATIIWILYNCIRDGIMDGTGIITVLKEVIPTITGAYCVLTTCIFLDLIRQRFRHLNETIVPHVSELPVTGSQDEITVYDVRYLHGVLLDSAELINTLYGISTLLTFMCILVEFVSVIYITIKEMYAQSVPVLIINTMFQTIYLFAMYHFTTYEANRVEERVIKYGLSFSNNKCRMDKIEMMLYFYHRRYSFTAAEFFPVDLTIFLPISSTVLTYLTLVL